RGLPHGAAELGLLRALFYATSAVEPLGNQRDHRMRRVGVELGAVRAAQARYIARKFDGGELHAEADAQIGNTVLTRIADRAHLALGTALAEAARDEDRVHLLQAAEAGTLLQLLGIDVVDVHPARGVNAGVLERLVQRLVRVLQVNVL